MSGYNRFSFMEQTVIASLREEVEEEEEEGIGAALAQSAREEKGLAYYI